MAARLPFKNDEPAHPAAAAAASKLVDAAAVECTRGGVSGGDRASRRCCICTRDTPPIQTSIEAGPAWGHCAKPKNRWSDTYARKGIFRPRAARLVQGKEATPSACCGDVPPELVCLCVVACCFSPAGSECRAVQRRSGEPTTRYLRSYRGCVRYPQHGSIDRSHLSHIPTLPFFCCPRAQQQRAAWRCVFFIGYARSMAPTTTPPTTPTTDNNDTEEIEEEEESLTLLVVAGVTSLARCQSLVTSCVSAPGRAAARPDLVVALGPFALAGEGEEEAAAKAGESPPWRVRPLDKGTVEGRAAAGAFCLDGSRYDVR